MDQAPSQPSQTVDVSGLPENAVREVQSLVTALRQQSAPSLVNAPYEEWSKALHEWAESHRAAPHAADWDRESIYGGRGE